MDSVIQQSLEKLGIVCREKGLPLTEQRRVVYEVLLHRSDHPTADQVFEAARSRCPRISRRTVYRVLDTLVELSIIGRVHHQGVAVRFDAKINQHHHLVCVKCQKVLDFESVGLNNISLPETAAQGFEIHNYSIQFVGVCSDCREKGL